MRFQNAYSTQMDIQGVMTDIKQQITGNDVSVLMVFASSNANFKDLNKALSEAYPNTLIYGCTTSGEITSGKMLKNGVSLLALGNEIVDKAQIEVIHNINGKIELEKAMKNFESELNVSLDEMNNGEYLGLILMDGMSGAEESVMDQLGNLTDLIFVGGSAGDDLKFEKTWVFANGEIYENAATLMIMKLKVPFEIVKTQSFCPLNKELTATKVSSTGRGVLEFNGKPAVEAYAEALGIKGEELSNYFMSNPVGLLAGEDDIYVRSPQRVEGNELHFYCSLPEGMTVSVLKSTDIIRDTTEAIDEAKNKLGGVSAVINFNCILRTLELEQEGNMDQYGAIFKDMPTVGFSTYGEAYIGHINQTATMVVFK